MDLLTFLHQKGFARFSRSTLWSTILALQCEDLLSRSFFMYIYNPFLWSFKNRVNQCCRRLFLFLSFFFALCYISLWKMSCEESEKIVIFADIPHRLPKERRGFYMYPKFKDFGLTHKGNDCNTNLFTYSFLT